MRKSLVALIVTMCLSLTACTPLEQSARAAASRIPLHGCISPLGNIPFIALFVAGYLIAGVGWWNLHFRSGIAAWVCCIILGIALALWGGWNWLIVGHSESVPQVSNSSAKGRASLNPFDKVVSVAIHNRRSAETKKAKYASVRVPTCIVIQESTVQDDSGVGVFDNVNLGLRKDILALYSRKLVATGRQYGLARISTSTIGGGQFFNLWHYCTACTAVCQSHARVQVESWRTPIVGIGETPFQLLIRDHDWRIGFLNPYIGGVIFHEAIARVPIGLSGEPYLESSQQSINSDNDKRDHSYNKLFEIVGAILLASGIVLLYKTWWKLSFDFTSHVNASLYVAFVIVAFILMWIGATLVGVSFHFFSLASFHGGNTLTA
jgi:hypothetical protein